MHQQQRPQIDPDSLRERLLRNIIHGERYVNLRDAGLVLAVIEHRHRRCSDLGEEVRPYGG